MHDHVCLLSCGTLRHAAWPKGLLNAECCVTAIAMLEQQTFAATASGCGQPDLLWPWPCTTLYACAHLLDVCCTTQAVVAWHGLTGDLMFHNAAHPVFLARPNSL